MKGRRRSSRNSENTQTKTTRKKPTVEASAIECKENGVKNGAGGKRRMTRNSRSALSLDDQVSLLDKRGDTNSEVKDVPGARGTRQTTKKTVKNGVGQKKRSTRNSKDTATPESPLVVANGTSAVAVGRRTSTKENAEPTGRKRQRRASQQSKQKKELPCYISDDSDAESESECNSSGSEWEMEREAKKPKLSTGKTTNERMIKRKRESSSESSGPESDDSISEPESDDSESETEKAPSKRGSKAKAAKKTSVQKGRPNSAKAQQNKKATSQGTKPARREESKVKASTSGVSGAKGNNIDSDDDSDDDNKYTKEHILSVYESKKKPRVWFQAQVPAKKPKVEEKASPKKDSSAEEKAQVGHSKEDILAVLKAQENLSDQTTKPGKDSDDSDWEEVEELPGQSGSPTKSQVPAKPLEITVEGPAFNQKKNSKTGWDPLDWFRQQINKFRKDTQLCVHKVHLLCQLAGNFRANSLCNNELLQAITLSLVPQSFLKGALKTWNLTKLEKFTSWFKETIVIKAGLQAATPFQLETALASRLENKEAATRRELVLLFLTVLRALGFDARLVVSLQSVTYKPNDLVAKNEKILNKWTQQFPKQKVTHSKGKSKPASADKSAPKAAKPSTSNNDVSADQSEAEKTGQPKVEETGKSKAKKGSSKKAAAPKARNQKAATEKKTTEKKKTGASKSAKKSDAKKLAESETGSGKRQRRSVSKVNYNEAKMKDGSDEEEDEVEEKLSKKGKAKKGKAAKSVKGKAKGKGKGKKTKKSDESDEDDFSLDGESEGESDSDIELVIDSESDFEEVEVKYRSPKPAASRSKPAKKSPATSSVKKGTDEWVEVYLASEKKWICIDVIRSKVIREDQEEMEKQATKGMSYVVAFDNDGSVKDLIKRYAQKWAATCKTIPDKTWWEDTLKPYKTLDEELDAEEDRQIQAQLLGRALPTSESEYKNHPLYILTKHLHKYDAIYPRTAIPVGYFKGEPVYARECVHTLHSRESWLKEGRMVSLGEEAYKWVKSWKRQKDTKLHLQLDIYGYWQTELYKSPPAVDGVVPRNAYGNVDMYKPWMLPPGTVHLKLPGLNRVARKLKLECARAMTGWDLHHGFTHPILDGFIICEEHQEALEAAWQEDQAIQLQREAEKKQKRVVGNWKLLVHSMLIRERLKRKYALLPADKGEKDDSQPTTTATAKPAKSTLPAESSSSGKAQDAALSWPANRQQATQEPKKTKGKGKGKKSKEQGHLFPFEIEEI